MKIDKSVIMHTKDIFSDVKLAEACGSENHRGSRYARQA
jgi:hypothetical protein